jgi:hypothetical protein
MGVKCLSDYSTSENILDRFNCVLVTKLGYNRVRRDLGHSRLNLGQQVSQERPTIVNLVRVSYHTTTPPHTVQTSAKTEGIVQWIGYLLTSRKP